MCEELLRVFLQDEKLVIISSTPQKYLRNVKNRSVILDAYCEGVNGKKYAVEMQKGDHDDHQKRVRYIGSNVDTRITEQGIDFKDIPDVYLIYLTKFHEIYINAEIDDGSETARLMEYIRHTKGRNETFKKLSDKVQYLKEEGTYTMCEAVEEYAREYAAEAERKAVETERKAAEAERKAVETEKQSVAELFKNGVSLELVLKSMKILDQETIREVYREVMGE